MTLEKAIEVLLDLLGEGPQYPPDHRRDAIKLGISALKYLQNLREDRWPGIISQLPAETLK